MRASVSADGKRLIFLRWAEAPVVYISEVQQAGRHLSPLRPLSLDERSNYPYTWTPVGKSVIFTSDRDGIFHRFKQAIDQPAPDLLVDGDQPVILARLNPDSPEILYALSPIPGDADRRVQLMRVPVAGGTPRMILAEPGINNFQCARSPSTLCVCSEYTSDHLASSPLIPLRGKKNRLPGLKTPKGICKIGRSHPTARLSLWLRSTSFRGSLTFGFFPSPVGRTGFSPCSPGPESRALTGLPMAAVFGLWLRRQPASRHS